MSLTFSHTVTRFGASASAWGSSFSIAPATVMPGTPRLTKTVRCGRAMLYRTWGHASRIGLLVPTPTESLAPTATYVIGGPCSPVGAGPASGPPREHAATN